MKNLLLTFCFVFCLVFNPLYSQINKVGVVTIFANKTINASEFGVMGFVNTLAQDEKFNLDKIIQDFKKELFEEFSKDFPFELVAEEEILNAEEYTQLCEARNTTITEHFIVTPEGYCFLDESGKVKEKLVELYGDKADAFLFADLDYYLAKKIEVGGFGIAYVRASVRLRIYDKEKNKIFKLKAFEKSKKTIKFALGGNAMEAEKILPLCEEATEKAFEELKKRLPKSIKKMNKKTK